jgi:RNA polymerase sigma factor (sigma-70 family)
MLITQLTADEEKAKWNCFKNGDKEAFAYIYHTQIQALYNYGSKITSDKEWLQDCIQDVFIEVWKYRQTLGETNSIKFYLFKCLRRKLTKQVPANTLALNENEIADFEITLSHETELILVQQSESLHKHLQHALQKLTKREKEAVFLKFYQDMTFEDIAEVMSLSLKATYNLLSKAIVHLRQQLQGSEVFVGLLVLLQG